MKFRLRQINVRVAKKFKKLPIVIDAFQITKEESVDTLEGTMTGNAGDWKITGVDGEKYYVAKDIFRRTYEPDDKAAQKAWDKAYG